MPVNGPTGPRPLTGTTPTGTTPATPSAPATPASPTAWKPAAATGTAAPRDGFSTGPGVRPLNLSLPRDFDLTGGGNPVRAGVNTAIDRFTSRVQTELHHDALSLARGARPISGGEALSAAQQDALKQASTDFLKELPIGALSPQLAAAVSQKLAAANIQVRDIASTRLGDLGKVGGDIAKDLLKDLRSDSPAAFYGLAAGAAAAAGYTAWTQGSEGLGKLGIKPEVKAGFFDDQLSVKLRGDWQAHFKDFKATATVGANVNLGDNGRLFGEVTANSRTGFESASVGYAIDRPNWNLSAAATFDRNGLAALSGRANYNVSDDLRLSAGIDRNVVSGTTTAFGEATYRVNNDVDFALSARRDSTGNSYVGAGLNVRF